MKSNKPPFWAHIMTVGIALLAFAVIAQIINSLVHAFSLEGVVYLAGVTCIAIGIMAFLQTRREHKTMHASAISEDRSS